MATAEAVEFRDLAPVRLFPVETEPYIAPEPLPALRPDVTTGLKVLPGLDAAMRNTLSDQLSLQHARPVFRSRLKPYVVPGLLGTRNGAPRVASSLNSSDRWQLGAENWRYIRSDGTDLTLGSFSPRTRVWGGGTRLGGIAITRALTDTPVPESQWQYGVALGAINYTNAAASSGALAYGAGASDAVLRYGVSPDLTFETQVQWAPDMITAGIGGMYSSAWGAWRVGVAKATRSLHEGWRYRVGYDLGLFDDLTLSWLSEQRSAGFSDLSNYTGFSGESGRRRNVVSTRFPMGRWGTLRGSYEHVASSSESLKQQFALSQQFWFSPHLRVSLSAQRDQLSGDYGLGLGLSLPIR